MNAKDKVAAMYNAGATNEQVAEWLFGPQWAMASTPKDGWEFKNNCWARVESKAKDRRNGQLQRIDLPAQPITIVLTPKTPGRPEYNGIVYALRYFVDQDGEEFYRIENKGIGSRVVWKLSSMTRWTYELKIGASGATTLVFQNSPFASTSDPDGAVDLTNIYNILVKL